ncbi:MAG: heme ABC exporter ATP-binding protein CcmA [Deltaproteobacteria bacterium]|nr:heme ABC exporter ATP-binding protein CcmA [Deltaproteobacteria bacterium]
MDHLVEIKDVARRFRQTWVLSRINLTINRGESVALFGNNGSGKSTLLKMIATLLAPTTGTIKVAGLDTRKGKRKIRERIRYLAHEKQLYEPLTAMENLRLIAGLRGWGRPGTSDQGLVTKDQKLKEILERVGIDRFRNHKVEELSEGTRKRLMLAKLLVGTADLILLDEPHPTLDIRGKEILNDMIRQWRKEGKTIVLAGHDHEQALSQADRLIILKDGTIDYDGAAGPPAK